MLEPIDDVKVQVQINTVTMKEIKEMNINILKIIEDLRQDVKRISIDGHPSKSRVNIPRKITTDKGFMAKTEEDPTSYIM